MWKNTVSGTGKIGEFMLKNIKGIISIEARGDNLYKFINAVREQRIVCTAQTCKDGVFTAQIYGSDVHKISELADNFDIEIKVIKKKGVRFKIYSNRFRVGIIIGVLIVCGFIFYLSNRVVTIEVNGNTVVTKQQIITSLESVGIYRGKFIPDIDFHRCEQRLKLSIPEISWTGIRHTGSRIIVDINEAVESPDMVNNNIPCNVISSKDAQITYAEVYAGKLSRKIGDGVKKGDIIISGTVDDGNGHFLKKHAMGKILGIYKEEIVFSQAFEEKGQVYADTIESRKYFDFFGFRIPLFFKNVESKTYDYNETVTPFKFLGFEIPLGMIHCNYHPFTLQTISYTQEEADEKLEQQTALHEKNFYDSKGIKIIERKITKQIYEDKIEYKINYTLEGEIGIDWEIYVD